MSYVTVLNPERDLWNRYVSSQPGSSLFQSYEWGQIRRAQGWEPIYVVVTRDEAWVGATLVLTRYLPGGLGAIMYSPCGPLLSPSRDDEGESCLRAMASAVGQLGRDIGGIFWRVEPRVQTGDGGGHRVYERAGFRRIAQEWSYWNRPKYEMHLPVIAGEDAVLSSMSTKTRTKIRHAPKRGLTVGAACHPADLDSLYGLLRHTAAKKSIPVQGKQALQGLYRTLAEAGMARLFIARLDGRPVAAGLSARFGSVASLLYLGNDYSVPRSSWALQWEMIRWAIGQGCTMYNFHGSATTYPPRTSDKGYGVYEFKRSFGAQLVAWYGYADYVFRPARYGVIRAIERGLPYGERLFVTRPAELLASLSACFLRKDVVPFCLSRQGGNPGSLLRHPRGGGDPGFVK